MYSEMKKNIENSDAPTSRPDTFAPVSVRERKMRKGTSGDAARDSMKAKTASNPAATASRPTVWKEPQPAFCASTSAYTSTDRPAVTDTAPATSKLRDSSSERLS